MFVVVVMSTCFYVELKSLVSWLVFSSAFFSNIVEASLRVLSPLPPLTEADLGSRLELYCNISGRPHPELFWLKDGHSLTSDLSWQLYEKKGYLISQALLEADAGNYTCIANNHFDFKELNTQLFIKTPPSKLVNVTVHPSTVVATVRWHVHSDGGYPITQFTLIYRPLCSNSTEGWHFPLPLHLSPTLRQYFVYHLKPGTDYMFRLWATNKLGPGEAVTIQASTAKPIDPPEVLQHMLGNTDDFSYSSSAWMVAISMVMGTVLILSCLSCILIYKEGRNELPEEGEEAMPHIITNPGFDIDLEESYLLDHADYNDNIERAIRTNNNTVVQPSRV